MPEGCAVTPAAPVTPQAPTPATPVTTPTTPAATTPAPEETSAEGETVPTAGEDEDTPDEGGVQGENAEGTPEDVTPVATASPGPSQEASAGELPFTGVNAWWLGLLGLSVAGTGMVLRRKVSSE
jgi:hypothetical protein